MIENPFEAVVTDDEEMVESPRTRVHDRACLTICVTDAPLRKAERGVPAPGCADDELTACRCLR